MIARVCAAQVARQIVRALHLPPEQTVSASVASPEVAKRKVTKVRKKKKAA